MCDLDLPRATPAEARREVPPLPPADEAATRADPKQGAAGASRSTAHVVICARLPLRAELYGKAGGRASCVQPNVRTGDRSCVRACGQPCVRAGGRAFVRGGAFVLTGNSTGSNAKHRMDTRWTNVADVFVLVMSILFFGFGAAWSIEVETVTWDYFKVWPPVVDRWGRFFGDCAPYNGSKCEFVQRDLLQSFWKYHAVHPLTPRGCSSEPPLLDGPEWTASERFVARVFHREWFENCTRDTPTVTVTRRAFVFFGLSTSVQVSGKDISSFSTPYAGLNWAKDVVPYLVSRCPPAAFLSTSSVVTGEQALSFNMMYRAATAEEKFIIYSCNVPIIGGSPGVLPDYFDSELAGEEQCVQPDEHFATPKPRASSDCPLEVYRHPVVVSFVFGGVAIVFTLYSTWSGWKVPWSSFAFILSIAQFCTVLGNADRLHASFEIWIYIWVPAIISTCLLTLASCAPGHMDWVFFDLWRCCRRPRSLEDETNIATAVSERPEGPERPKFEPEPRGMLADPALVERCRPQLLAIYKELSPGDVPRVDEVLHHFLAMDNGVQELNNRLQTKYGRHIELNNIV